MKRYTSEERVVYVMPIQQLWGSELLWKMKEIKIIVDILKWIIFEFAF